MIKLFGISHNQLIKAARMFILKHVYEAIRAIFIEKEAALNCSSKLSLFSRIDFIESMFGSPAHIQFYLETRNVKLCRSLMNFS